MTYSNERIASTYIGSKDIYGNSINPATSDSQTLFSEQLVAPNTPIEQVLFTYGIGDKVETFTSATGTATTENGLSKCTTGTTIYGYGVIRTKRALIYRPGQIGCCLITSIFNSGVASSLQIAGCFSATDAACWGYNGTDFGVLHRYGGALEIQKLQVTAAASGAETATVTLDSTGYSIPVTSGSVEHNAREIGEYLDANQSNWNTQIIDDTVVCIAQSVGDKTGTFSVSSTGTLTGSFTETLAGAANTSDWTTSSNFNTDTVSWLNPQKGNIYKVDFQYLGFGAIRFFVFNPEKNNFTLAHVVKYANSQTVQNFRNPSLKAGWAISSLGSTTDMTIKGGSMAIFNQGIRVKREESHAYAITVSVTTTFTLLFSIMNRIEFGGIPNLAELVPIFVTGASDSSKTTIVEIFKNATIDGTEDFQYVDETNQIALIDTAGTTYTSGDGKLLASTVFSATGSGPEIDFTKLKAFLAPGDKLSIVAKVASGAASDVSVSLDWDEDL
jgi:hypothetical protein